MLFAQFYDYGAVSKGELFEACGDRSVVIYDGRLNHSSVFDDAKKECSKRKYHGVALFKGETFTRASRITPIIEVN